MKIFKSLKVIFFVAVASVYGSTLSFAADGSVRFASSGPVSLSQDQGALIGLLLPAVQRMRATIYFVNGKGQLLATRMFTLPEDYKNPFFGVSYDLRLGENGDILLGDGSVRTSIGNRTVP